MHCATHQSERPDFTLSRWPGVRIATLTTAGPGGTWCLLELAAGAHLPAQQSAGKNWLLVLSGSLQLDGRILKAQDCTDFPPGPPHPAEALEASLCLIGQIPAGST